MNTVNPEKRETVLRGLAIAGLIGILLFIAWLSVQIVSVAPSAFTSLASLADGISEYEKTIQEQGEPLVVKKDTDLQTSGEFTTLSWETSDEGIYSLSQTCVDGVKVSVLSEDGIREINCGTDYNLGNTNNVVLIAESTSDRYIDVPYTVSYSRSTDAQPYRSGSVVVTVVNKEVDQVGEESVITEETTTDELASADDASESENSQTPDTNTSTGSTYEYEYKIPVSDPSGFTELGITYLGVGGIVNGLYKPGQLEQNSTGAVQFEVKNIGTKTSVDWTFSINLPDGSTYTSEAQKPLKPNERATLTIGLQTGEDSTHTFVGKITTDDDRASNNNSFTRFVTINN